MSVTVNDIEITNEAINVESANYEGGSILERQHHAAVSLVVRELLRQRADQIELEADNEEARLEAVVDRDVAVPEADDDTCRAYYEKNRERFYTEPLVEARHILLAAAPEDVEERDRLREVAESLIARLRKDIGAFPRLAREHSSCPSADQGGNLGQLSRGQTVPEFENRILHFGEGLAERPIETRYGWHVAEVMHRVDGEPLPFEAVRERIAAYLTERSRRRAFSQYVRLLASQAEIEGIELGGQESPLIQ